MRQAGLACMTWVACAATFMGVSNLIAAGTWLTQLAVLTFLITLMTWVITRLVGTSHPVWAAVSAEIVGLAIWIGQLCAVAGGGVGAMRFVPTSAALHNVAARVTQAITALPDYGRPALNADLFEPLALVGLGPICVLTVCLALVVRRPVWIGLPLVVCWALFLVGTPTGSLGWAMVSVVAYLLVVALADKPRRWLGRLRVRGIAVVMVATIGGLAATLVAPAVPGWGAAQTWVTDWSKAYVDSTGISIDGPVNIGDSLRRQSDEVLFSTTGDLTGPLKLGSMSVFDGTNWSASSDGWTGIYDDGDVIGGLDPTRATNDDASLGWTSQVPSAWSQAASITVDVARLGSSSLPISVGPRSVTTSRGHLAYGGLEYDSVTDALRTNRGSLDEGDTYVIQSMALDRTALVARPVTAELQPDQWLGADYGHAQEITDLTRSILGDTSDQDAMLQAIQAYLRSPQFSYTTMPRWQGAGDPVWSFLTDKHGYCVHFASAMVEMATSVGIPMRVSVGYLPGEVTADGSREVTGVQAHMWPEAFFEGLGWVGYEPTPGTGDGVAGGADLATASPTPTPTPTDSAQPSAVPSQSTNPTDAPTTPQPSAGQSRWTAIWPWLATLVGAIVLGLLVGLGVVSHIRRYRPQDAWDAIWQVALEREIVTVGMSLRTATVAINRRLGAQSVLAEQVSRLCAWLELSRYAPSDPPHHAGATRVLGGDDPAQAEGPALWRLKNEVIKSLKTR